MRGEVFDNTLKSNRLRDLLRQSIASGTLAPGDRLPSEPEMALRYKVSRSTVREATTALAQEGLLYRVHGKGTFVAEPKPQRRTFATVLPYLFFSEQSPTSAGTDVIPRLMQSIEGEARRVGASILLYLDNHMPELERENITTVLQQQADGVLMYYIGGDTNLDLLEQVRAAGTPLVMVDRYVDSLPLDFVVTDNELGAYRATRLLQAQGFPRVVHITIPDDDSAVRDRRTGYERAMREAGHSPVVLSIDERHLDSQGADRVSEEERAYRLAQTLLDTMPLPLAVFTVDAPILAGIWRALEERNLPYDQLALACFDEPFVPFPRTFFSLKVLQPFAEIGQHSIRILQERIAGTGPEETYRVFLEPTIVTSKV